VLVNGGRVEYVTDQGKQSLYWNIPIANTTTLLLGTGTSITQAAMRELAKAGVMVGCGGGGTPLFTAGERELDIAWQSPNPNTGQPNTCNTGLASGLTNPNGWPQPSSCNWPGWSASRAMVG
jgi:CRISPR-associated endonuclease Cas1 subtype I-F